MATYEYPIPLPLPPHTADPDPDPNSEHKHVATGIGTDTDEFWFESIFVNYCRNSVINEKISILALDFERKVLFSLCQCLSTAYTGGILQQTQHVSTNITNVDINNTIPIDNKEYLYTLFHRYIQQLLQITPDQSQSQSKSQSQSHIDNKEKIIQLLNKTQYSV